jgi:predicted phage tail protein
MLKTLTLKGVAAKKFGRIHRFHVADIREMLRAMCSQVPGFKKYMSNAHHSGVRFAFFGMVKILGWKSLNSRPRPANLP